MAEFPVVDLTAEPIQTIQPSNYMTVRRDMNLHDFIDPSRGGERLVGNLDSARAELFQFMGERGMQLAEPFEIRINVEVTARTEPALTDD